MQLAEVFKLRVLVFIIIVEELVEWEKFRISEKLRFLEV